jgi:hypothetical protein
LSQKLGDRQIEEKSAHWCTRTDCTLAQVESIALDQVEVEGVVDAVESNVAYLLR